MKIIDLKKYCTLENVFDDFFEEDKSVVYYRGIKIFTILPNTLENIEIYLAENIFDNNKIYTLTCETKNKNNNNILSSRIFITLKQAKEWLKEPYEFLS